MTFGRSRGFRTCSTAWALRCVRIYESYSVPQRRVDISSVLCRLHMALISTEAEFLRVGPDRKDVAITIKHEETTGQCALYEGLLSETHHYAHNKMH